MAGDSREEGVIMRGHLLTGWRTLRSPQRQRAGGYLHAHPTHQLALRCFIHESLSLADHEPQRLHHFHADAQTDARGESSAELTVSTVARPERRVAELPTRNRILGEVSPSAATQM